jgi:hypothetical protein
MPTKETRETREPRESREPREPREPREYTLVDLEQKDMGPLLKVAAAVGLQEPDLDKASKHTLIFKILEAQAKKQGLLFSEGVLE